MSKLLAVSVLADGFAQGEIIQVREKPPKTLASASGISVTVVLGRFYWCSVPCSTR